MSKLLKPSDLVRTKTCHSQVLISSFVSFECNNQVLFCAVSQFYHRFSIRKFTGVSYLLLNQVWSSLLAETCLKEKSACTKVGYAITVSSQYALTPHQALPGSAAVNQAQSADRPQTLVCGHIGEMLSVSLLWFWPVSIKNAPNNVLSLFSSLQRQGAIPIYNLCLGPSFGWEQVHLYPAILRA